MLSVKKTSDKIGYTIVALGLTGAVISLALFCIERVLPNDSADSFHIWFQFILGNWPSRWEEPIDRKTSAFAAVMLLKLLLGFAPIYGVIVIFSKLVTLERRQLMRIIDLINLRDILLMDAVIDKLKIPEEQKEEAEHQLRMAFDAVNEELYSEQAPILLGPENAQLLKERLDRDIFQST